MTDILLMSPKGGVGRTCLIAHLAIALSRRRKRVVVVELDPQNTMSDLLSSGAEREHGVYWAIRNRRPTSPRRVENGVLFAPFGASPIPSPAWRAEDVPGLTELTRFYREESDAEVVLIDAPAGENLITCGISADLRLHVLLPDAGSLAALRVSGRGRQLLSATRPEQDLAVFNAVDLRRPLARDITERIHQRAFPAWCPMVRYDEEIAEAHAQNTTVWSTRPESPGAQDLGALADELINRAQALQASPSPR